MDMISANITSLDAAYDGLKTTLNIMVNITDGLDWPLKAAPQTFLYILQLFEVGSSLHHNGRLSKHRDVELAGYSAKSYRAIVLCTKAVECRGSSLVGRGEGYPAAASSST